MFLVLLSIQGVFSVSLCPPDDDDDDDGGGSTGNGGGCSSSSSSSSSSHNKTCILNWSVDVLIKDTIFMKTL